MNPDPTPVQLDDIQAIVGSGLAGLRHARYWLLHVERPDDVRVWLRQLLDAGLVKSVADLGRGQGGSLHREAAMVAFSHAGLARLGVCEHDDHPFPSAFREGMDTPQREQLFADDPHAGWDWSDAAGSAFQAHLLVAHFWADGAVPDARLDAQALSAAGMRALQVRSCPSAFSTPAPGEATVMHEPFGFRDGIGQPVLHGFPRSRGECEAQRLAGERFDNRVVATGEFVLGYTNEYHEPAYCPDVQGWPQPPGAPRFGHNGSYLAVRQICQDVEAFKRFEQSVAIPEIGAKMMGRYSSGQTLVQHPRAPAEIDAFRYLVDDAHGFQCPRGAHARRANPRDGLASDVASGIAASKLHRLLRRGRVYASACAAQAAGAACNGDAARRGCGEGLLFIALNADLDRQFEFVQQRWIAGSGFGDLRDEQDPILGTSEQRCVTVQGLPVGTRIGPLPRFATVHGGGYFFLPGLKALRFVAEPGGAG